MNFEKLNRHKSPAIDQIRAELIKIGDRTIRSEMHKLVNSVWNKEELPEQWEKIVLPICKKGDETDCNYYRGISLYQLCTQFCPTSFCQS
jgi:hypothetical protein